MNMPILVFLGTLALWVVAAVVCGWVVLVMAVAIVEGLRRTRQRNMAQAHVESIRPRNPVISARVHKVKDVYVKKVLKEIDNGFRG